MTKAIHTIITLISATLIILPQLPGDIASNFIHLSLCGTAIIAIQALATAIYTIRRKPTAWLYGTLLAASMLAYGKNHIPGGETITTNDHKLRIVSWNVKNFHITADTLRKAAEKINTLDADIICLQERPHDNLLHRDSIRAAFPRHPNFCTNDREDEVLNIAILSRYPLTNIATHYFDPGYNKMIQADVETPHGTITLWNVHLQTTGGTPIAFTHHARRRNQQADQLKKHITQSPTPTIVCGDFNDTPTSYAYRTIAKDMHDSYRVAGKAFTGSYQPAGNIVRIDYILCSKQMQPTAYQLISNPWSDHKIQVADITYK